MTTGLIQTVLGLVKPNAAPGFVMTHEHLLHDVNPYVFHIPWPHNVPEPENMTTISLENVGWVRQYPYSFKDNLIFSGEKVEAAVLKELKFFRRNGGGTIVDNCSIGLRAKNHAVYLEKLSKETRVNIVAGTGFYVASSQSSHTFDLTNEELQGVMTKDLTVGMDGTGIKCGVIGEIGCSFPLNSFEITVLQAAAEVQETLHCPVIIHPGRSASSPDDIMRIFLEAGGKADHTVMSHIDRTFPDKTKLAEFAEIGCYCEMDLFGLEVSHYQLDRHFDMPNDGQRISYMQYLMAQGFTERILISHDIHTKHRLLSDLEFAFGAVFFPIIFIEQSC